MDGWRNIAFALTGAGRNSYLAKSPDYDIHSLRIRPAFANGGLK
jgi:hypothetical protein